ncbi:MAG: YeeE/YedE family protein [Saprospiraceae bacterium]|nr:YeeE/YedE family protein [Saprospiraceae bacterium]MCB9321183.1 YeeE/YedE family protein [Lewinellaceae bacterium]
MKMSRFIFVGILFGITLYKSEAVSWFRIYEMFNFQSFHMYGIILSAIAAGIIGVQIIKRNHLKSIEGEEIQFHDKDKTYPRYIIGGFIFGLGWALAGVCPGPMFILLGSGYTVLIVFLASAMLGTFVYGLLRKRLPH